MEEGQVEVGDTRTRVEVGVVEGESMVEEGRVVVVGDLADMEGNLLVEDNSRADTGFLVK